MFLFLIALLEEYVPWSNIFETENECAIYLKYVRRIYDLYLLARSNLCCFSLCNILCAL